MSSGSKRPAEDPTFAGEHGPGAPDDPACIWIARVGEFEPLA